MFSLAKIAYYVCNEQERWLYDSLETVRIDLLSCCEIALSATRAEVHSNEPQDVTGSPKSKRLTKIAHRQVAPTRSIILNRLNCANILCNTHFLLNLSMLSPSTQLKSVRWLCFMRVKHVSLPSVTLLF